MRSSWILAVLSALVAGCARGPVEGTGDEGQLRRAASSQGISADGGGGGLRLTAEGLERYLAYQKRALEVWAPAGGSKAALRTRAAQEEKARQESGFSEEELEDLERMVNAVMAKRSQLRSVDYAGLISQHEQLLEKLPPESKEAVQRQLDGLRRTRDELTALEPEKAAYGAANVEVLLTRDDELLKGWSRMLQIWAGTK